MRESVCVHVCLGREREITGAFSFLNQSPNIGGDLNCCCDWEAFELNPTPCFRVGRWTPVVSDASGQQ